MVGNPFFGKMSDRTSSPLGMRRPWMVIGLVGGSLLILLAGGTATLLGVIEPDSALKNLAAAPEFVWELSLGIYLMVKGFKPSPITAATTAGTTPSAPANSPSDHRPGPGPRGPGPAM
jgi:MFS family permease